MTDETYAIVRMSFNKGRQTIRTGLTLEEAQQHCRDAETSSRTASQETLDAEPWSDWFDGYEVES